MKDTTGKFTNKDNHVELALVGIAALIGIVALMFLGCVVQAWVLCKLWAWYITPFFGLKQITMAVAFGICLICSYLQHYIYIEDKRKTSDKVIVTVLRPLLVLLFGWFGTFFL